jgi:hypothetical protein
MKIMKILEVNPFARHIVRKTLLYVNPADCERNGMIQFTLHSPNKIKKEEDQRKQKIVFSDTGYWSRNQVRQILHVPTCRSRKHRANTQ